MKKGWLVVIVLSPLFMILCSGASLPSRPKGDKASRVIHAATPGRHPSPLSRREHRTLRDDPNRKGRFDTSPAWKYEHMLGLDMKFSIRL